MPKLKGGTRPKPIKKIKSAWGRHVRTWMLSNPGIGYREAQARAKASYAGGKAKAPPRARATPKAKPEAVARLEPWRQHVVEHKSQNPNQSLKQVLQEAKVTYREKPVPAPRVEPPKKKSWDEMTDSDRMEMGFTRAMIDQIQLDKARSSRQRGNGVSPLEPKPEPLPKLEHKAEPEQKKEHMRGGSKCGCGRRSCHCDKRRCADSCCEY